MPSFVVDPILTTLPAEVPPNEVRAWLDALDAWLTAQEASPFEWKHFFPATLALVEAGRFPDFLSLKRLKRLSGHGLNLESLHKHLMLFFRSEEHDIRSMTATKCVVVADGDVVIAPPSFVDRNLPEVRGALVDGLLCLAADKAAGEEIAGDTHIATLPLPDGAKDAWIQAQVGLLDPEEMSRRLGAATLDQRFPFLFAPEDLAAFDVTIEEEVHDGQDLWNRREELFPDLDLCKEVEVHVRRIRRGDVALRSILGRLRALQSFFESWDGHPIDPKSSGFGSKCTPESQATLTQYRDEHTFTPPRGPARVFSLHLRFTPGAGRIYFDGEHDQKRGLVGHIGPHLPTVNG